MVSREPVLQQRARKLSTRRYVQRGYVDEHPTSATYAPAGQPGRAETFLLEGPNGLDAGTVTLIFDSPAGLPADHLYPQQVQHLRKCGRRLVEVTRLAISENQAGAQFLLVRLFFLIYLFARKVRRFDDFIIEVNPRHVGYYCRFFNFEIIGQQKACPRVNGAPAILLRLDLQRSERVIEQVGRNSYGKNAQLIYRYAFTPLQEKAACKILKALSESSDQRKARRANDPLVSTPS